MMDFITRYCKKNKIILILSYSKTGCCEWKMKIPHLVQYQGSKRALAPQIIQHFPRKFKRLFEPFAGIATISIACAYYEYTNQFLINDLNPALANLLKLVVKDPAYVSDTYKTLWQQQFDDNMVIIIHLDNSELQIDHRIPYEIGCEPDKSDDTNFMLLSGSSNRQKSWNCEHCINFKELKKKEICISCYWAYPENYTHAAMKEIRRIDLIWYGG